jgi:hypothetical protein
LSIKPISDTKGESGEVFLENEKERLVSKGREWVYCPWCGKKIEVKK